MTEDEFAEVVRQAEGFWPNRPFPENTLDMWWSQMQSWKGDLLIQALPALAREFHWLPSFAQISEGYRIEVLKAAPRENKIRHLSAVSDPELRDRWRRVISAQLRSPAFGNPAVENDSPVAKGVRRHYRHDPGARGIVVMDGGKMLADAEQALAETAFGQED